VIVVGVVESVAGAKKQGRDYKNSRKYQQNRFDIHEINRSKRINLKLSGAESSERSRNFQEMVAFLKFARCG